MTTRRDLLKIFGIGTAIVPLIGGVPEVSQPAELIALPSVKPLEVVHQMDAQQLAEEAFRSQAKLRMIVTFEDQSGRRFQFSADTFIQEMKASIVDVTAYGSPWREYVRGPYAGIEWELRGTLIAQSGELKVTPL